MSRLSSKQRWIVKLVIVGLAVAIAAFLVCARTFITPDVAGLPANAPQRCIAVFVVCVSLWFTNLIPPGATGMLAIALLPVLGVLPKQRAFALFGNSAVFFMLGVFLLAGATISTGLSKRITLQALQRFDRSPRRLVVGLAVSAAFLSFWMPEHAVAAMIYPIVVEIVDTLRLPRGHGYAKKLFLALAWGAVIGGIATFLGGARAPLALSMLASAYPDAKISFLKWMFAALPIVIAMTLIAIVVLHVRVGENVADIKPATRMLDERVRRLGPMSGAEWRLALLGLATIAAWITIGHSVGLAVIAILSSTVLFALRIVDWRGVQEFVNWGVLVMYGGAVALGQALGETQAMAWLAHRFIPEQAPAFVVLLILVVATMGLTEVISNSAAVAILLPIGYSLGAMSGIDPITITLMITIPSGLAFLLPVSSPPNAISFSAGHYGFREVVQLGWPMTVAAFVVVVLAAWLWWPIALGMSRL